MNLYNNEYLNDYCRVCYTEYEKWCLLKFETYDKISQMVPASILKKYSSTLQIKDGIFNYICEFCYKEFLNINELLIVWEKCEKYGKNSCRTCSIEFEDKNLISFNKFSKNSSFDLFEKLGVIIGDYILNNYDRPKHICKYCLLSVVNFNNFIQIIQKSYQEYFKHKNNKDINLKPKKIKEDYFHSIEKNNSSVFSLENLSEKLNDNFCCELCTPVKNFLTSGALKLHLKTTHRTHQYNCQFCQRAFSSKHQRNDHENVHSNNRPYICDVKNCDKTFHKNSEFVLHKKNHSELFQNCKVCGKKNLINLKSHMKLHLQNRYKCPACPRTFLTLMSLEIHSKMHRKPTDNERQYKCEYCLSIFKRRDRLKEHINALHLKIKPHICQICEKKFTAGYQLNTHMKQVHSESAFSCDECGRTYSLLISLTKHKKIVHNNLKKFKCEICGEGFNTFNKFKKHQDDDHNLDDNEKKKIIYEAYKQIHKNIYKR